MELLKERIRRDGVIKEGNVLKVDSFFKPSNGHRTVKRNWKRV